jgi:hypothetical protein
VSVVAPLLSYKHMAYRESSLYEAYPAHLYLCRLLLFITAMRLLCALAVTIPYIHSVLCMDERNEIWHVGAGYGEGNGRRQAG